MWSGFANSVEPDQLEKQTHLDLHTDYTFACLVSLHVFWGCFFFFFVGGFFFFLN